MEATQTAVPRGAIVLVLLAVATALIVAVALTKRPREFPMTATCPDTLLVTDEGDCRRWASEIITDVHLDIRPDGSCRVCADRLGP